MKIGDWLIQLISVHAISETGTPSIGSDVRNQVKQHAGSQTAFPESQPRQPPEYSWLSCVDQLSTKTYGSFMRPYLP